MLGINLCKAEDLAVGQRTAEVLLHLLQVRDFLGAERQAFLLVVGFQVLDVQDGFGLAVGGEDILIQALVHALQHRVVVGVLVLHGEIFLDARDALETHVLGNLHGIGAPRGNHLAARAHEVSRQVVFSLGGSLPKKPAKFADVRSIGRVVALGGNHALRGGSEKENHIYTVIIL